MEIADRVAVLRAGRIEQVDVPDKLYAEPASAYVHEFLGESVRFDCTVNHGRADIAGLYAPLPVGDCPPGPAIALIRPHEIEVLPGPGAARVDSVHASGPLRRVRISLAGQTFDVLRARNQWTPGSRRYLPSRPNSGSSLSIWQFCSTDLVMTLPDIYHLSNPPFRHRPAPARRAVLTGRLRNLAHREVADRLTTPDCRT
jgi:hypothetical protein